MSASDPTRVPEPARPMRVFLCGDVMTGRGIDQVLPHPCEPTLHEGFSRHDTSSLES